jgi:hypothetical protein
VREEEKIEWEKSGRDSDREWKCDREWEVTIASA